MTGEVVLVAVKRTSRGHVESFASARDIRSALRARGFAAYLWEARLEAIARLAERSDVRVFCVSELATTQHGGTQPLRQVLAEAGIDVVGSGAEACALAADKAAAAEAMRAGGIRVPEHARLEPGTPAGRLAAHAESLGWPVVLKPVTGGGSRDVSLVANLAELVARWAELSERGEPFLLQAFVVGKELTVWVTGDQPRVDETVVLAVDVPEGPIYSRALKCTGSGAVGRPIQLPGPIASAVRTAALGAHDAVGAFGYSRVDLVLAEEGPIVLEVNPCARLLQGSTLGIDAGRSESFADMVVRVTQLRRSASEVA